MIDKLTITNLKCFGEKTEICLAPLTLLYGENSGGKSTILLALRLLRDFHLRADSTERLVMPFRDIVTGRETKRIISLELRGALKTLVYEDHEPNGADLYEDTYLSWESLFSWDTENLRPKVTAVNAGIISAAEVANLPKDELLPFVFQFQEEGAEIPLWVEPLSKNENEVLASRIQDIRSGVDRLIEKTIMQEYLESNQEAAEVVKKTVDASHGVLFVCNISKAVKQQADRKRMTASSHIQEWRSGLPTWIQSCPPAWKTYRKSLAFKKRAAELRKNRYSHILNWCDKPSMELFSKYSCHVSLRRGLTEPSFVADSLVGDLLTAIQSPTIHIHVAHMLFDLKTKIETLKVNPKQAEILALRQQQVQASLERIKYKWRECLNGMQGLIRSLAFLAPLRECPTRIYSFAENDRSPPFHLAENKDNLCQRVNNWMKKLNIDYTVEVKISDMDGFFQVMFRDIRNQNLPPVNYADVGFGISQILPILVAGLSGKNSIIVIEQPELHIHPRLQAELASFFAECIKERGHQFIIETHSEHIMLRVQRLLREKKMRTEDVAVRYICRSDSGSNVQELRLDDDGDFLDPWPGGFFPERFKEILHS